MNKACTLARAPGGQMPGDATQAMRGHRRGASNAAAGLGAGFADLLMEIFCFWRFVVAFSAASWLNLLFRH